jgi:hypothetical protein
MLVKLNVTVPVALVTVTVSPNAPVKLTGYVDIDVIWMTAFPVVKYPGACAALQPFPAAPQKLSALPKNGSINDPTVSAPLNVSAVVAVVIFPVLTELGPAIDAVKDPFGWTGSACAVAANANRASGPNANKASARIYLPPQFGSPHRSRGG